MKNIECSPIFRRWNTYVVDGHDVDALCKALHEATTVKGRPTCILTKTFKGKGIPGKSLLIHSIRNNQTKKLFFSGFSHHLGSPELFWISLFFIMFVISPPITPPCSYISITHESFHRVWFFVFLSISFLVSVHLISFLACPSSFLFTRQSHFGFSLCLLC